MNNPGLFDYPSGNAAGMDQQGFDQPGTGATSITSLLQSGNDNRNAAHTCNICHKSFKTKQKLTHHMDSHDDSKKFICDYPNCDRRYRSSTLLKNHKNSHKDLVQKNTPNNLPNPSSATNHPFPQSHPISKNFFDPSAMNHFPGNHANNMPYPTSVPSTTNTNNLPPLMHLENYSTTGANYHQAFHGPGNPNHMMMGGSSEYGGPRNGQCFEGLPANGYPFCNNNNNNSAEKSIMSQQYHQQYTLKGQNMGQDAIMSNEHHMDETGRAIGSTPQSSLGLPHTGNNIKNGFPGAGYDMTEMNQNYSPAPNVQINTYSCTNPNQYPMGDMSDGKTSGSYHLNVELSRNNMLYTPQSQPAFPPPPMGQGGGSGDVYDTQMHQTNADGRGLANFQEFCQNLPASKQFPTSQYQQQQPMPAFPPQNGHLEYGYENQSSEYLPQNNSHAGLNYVPDKMAEWKSQHSLSSGCQSMSDEYLNTPSVSSGEFKCSTGYQPTASAGAYKSNSVNSNSTNSSLNNTNYSNVLSVSPSTLSSSTFESSNTVERFEAVAYNIGCKRGRFDSNPSITLDDIEEIISNDISSSSVASFPHSGNQSNSSEFNGSSNPVQEISDHDVLLEQRPHSEPSQENLSDHQSCDEVFLQNPLENDTQTREQDPHFHDNNNLQDSQIQSECNQNYFSPSNPFPGNDSPPII